MACRDCDVSRAVRWPREGGMTVPDRMPDRMRRVYAPLRPAMRLLCGYACELAWAGRPGHAAAQRPMGNA